VAPPTQTRPPGRLKVPFVDLGPAHNSVKTRVLERIAAIIERGDFTNGAAVAEFEERFSEYTGRQACVGVSSGLDALRLALVASGLEPGAGVVVPAATFAATFEAVVQAEGRPVVVDVSDNDYTLDLHSLQSDSRYTHVVPVHLYGQMNDMRELARLAATRELQIVEDACQAHGAQRDDVRPGDVSAAAAFSFYPAKNLGAMGDAGALITDNADLAEHVRALRQHGETSKYHHELIGYTARLDTIQAAILVEKLPLLDEWNELRRAAVGYYTEALAAAGGLRLPAEAPGSRSAWHLFVIRVERPDELAEYLAARGIQTGRHYPEPPHLAPAYRGLGYAPGDFPVAEALSREALSLPLFPGITEEQLEWVSRSVLDYLGAA
jgi:dTDP-4-amino-4,6-dideoxygalactose transaminase